jgi:PAS domain S-box-containing protein
VEAAFDAIITIDADGRVLQFNRAAERMFGYTRDEAIGRALGDLVVPPDHRPAHRERITQLRAGESQLILDRRLEVRGLRRNGEEFPAEVIITQTGDDPVIWTGFVRDLTQLKEAVDGGARAIGMYQAAEELAAIGSWEMDVRSGDAAWSDGMYRIHGREKASFSVAIEPYLEVVHAEDRERIAKILNTVVEHPEQIPGEGVTIEYRVVRPDGEIRAIRARGRIEPDEHGPYARWVGVGQDITEHRRTERELHAHHAVEQAFRDWESFDEGVTSLLRRLGTALEYELGALWAPDAKDGSLRCRSFWSGLGIDGGEFEILTRLAALRPGEGAAGRAFDSAQPVLVDDLRITDAGLGRGEAAARMGLQAALAIPVVGQHGPLAVLSYYSHERHELTERLVRTLTTIGRELGRFLERRRADLGPGPISPRELDVLRLAADGNSGPEIARQLGLSPATVKTHFENIYDKLGVSDRAAAVAHAMRIGLIR